MTYLSNQFSLWKRVRKATGYRSLYETAVAEHLPSGVLYEPVCITYTVEKVSIYKPDWLLPEQCICLEAKGLFPIENRAKMLLVRQQYPDLDIRILFQRAQTPLQKGSKYTYEDWCKKHGFPCAQGPRIPDAWLHHKPDASQQQAFAKIMSGRKKRGQVHEQPQGQDKKHE